MQRIQTDSPTFYIFESFRQFPLRHAVLTRHGGVSVGPHTSLNLSIVVGDDELAVHENVRRAYTSIDLPAERGVKPWMVHGSRTRLVEAIHAGQRMDPCDGMVTVTPALPLAMTFADCQPILIYDPVHHALGLGHAGWRGTLQGIAWSLVAALQHIVGSRPADLFVGLGPAIGACCYEVGPDVVAQAEQWPGGARWLVAGPKGRSHFDLTTANQTLLQRAGVPEAQIECAHLCTACHTEDFFSYRAEKPVTGRFAVLAALEDQPKFHP